MIQYSEEVRREALKVFREEGIRAACERFHVPKSSIYRWRRKERLMAGFASDARGSQDAVLRSGVVGVPSGQETDRAETAQEKKDMLGQHAVISSETDHSHSAMQLPGQAKPVESDADVPDMITLLVAENEKLRIMNLQLRKALQAFVM